MRDWMQLCAMTILSSGCGGESVGVEPADAAVTEPSVQASKGPCPALLPDVGAPCSRPTGFTSLLCEYGTNEDFECNLLASCTGAAAGGDDRWVVVQPPRNCPPAGWPTGAMSLPADCPTPRPHIGDACDGPVIPCWYPETPWPLRCESGVWWPDPPQ